MSTTPLHVTGNDADRLVVAETVASLPVSYAHGRHGSDVSVIAGDGDWPALAAQAIDRGVRGVLVTAPREAEPDEVARLADLSAARSVPVVLDEPYAGNPALAASSAAIGAALADATVIVARGTGPTAVGIREIAFDVVRALRAAGITDLAPRTTTSGRGGLVIDGTGSADARPVPVSILAATSDALAPSVALRAYAPRVTLEIDLPSPRTARPAHVAVSGPDGALVAPTLYESAHRSSWRALHRAVDAGEGSGPSLHAFAEDLRMVRTATA